MSTEYSQAVRDVVRAIGTGSISWQGLSSLDGDGVSEATTAGLILTKFPDMTRYALSVAGRALFREIGRQNRRAIDSEIRRRKSDPERLYPMGKQQPAQIDCRREYCKYHMYGRCTNPAPAITLNGAPSMTNEKGVCWSYKERWPEPEPEPTPAPLCPVCGKPASEHQDGLLCCARCGGVMRTFEWACGWWSTCSTCSTHGPTRHELADAIEAGNRRA